MFTYLATQITHTQSTHMNTHGPCLHANGLFYSLIHLFSIPVSSQIALIPPFSHLGSFPNRVLIYPAQSQHVFPASHTVFHSSTLWQELPLVQKKIQRTDPKDTLQNALGSWFPSLAKWGTNLEDIVPYSLCACVVWSIGKLIIEN